MQLLQPMHHRAIFTFLPLWLALLLVPVLVSVSPPVKAIPPGTVITLQWFHDQTDFTVRVYVARAQAKDAPAHRLLLPEKYRDLLTLEGVTKLSDSYLYKVRPLTNRGQAQILITDPLKTVVTPSRSADLTTETESQISKPKLNNIAAFAINGQPAKDSYRLIWEGGATSFDTQHEFVDSVPKKYRNTAVKLITTHNQFLDGDAEDEMPILVFSAYTDGNLEPLKRTRLQEYLHLHATLSIPPTPRPAPPTPVVSSLPEKRQSPLDQLYSGAANASLDQDTLSLLKTPLAPGVLGQISNHHPQTANRVLTLIPEPSDEALFKDLSIPMIAMLQAFKDTRTPREDIPILLGGKSRTDQETQALSFVYETFLLPPPCPTDAPTA